MSTDPARPNKRRLIANCAALHGPDAFLTLVAEVYTRTRTATNLLGIIRATPRGRQADVPSPPPLRVMPASELEPAPPRRPATGRDWDLDLPLGIVDPGDRTHVAEHVACRAYEAHQTSHRYLGEGRWACDRCPDLAMAS